MSKFKIKKFSDRLHAFLDDYFKDKKVVVNKTVKPTDDEIRFSREKVAEFSEKLHMAWSSKNWELVTTVLIEMEEYGFDLENRFRNQ